MDEPWFEKPRPGWRWESWGGVQVQVPDDWGYGALSQWCVGSDRGLDPHTEVPVVEPPEGVTTLVDCGGEGLGLKFAPAGRDDETDAVPGASVTSRVVGDVRLTVVSYGDLLARRILRSAEPITGRDAAGCEARHPIPQLGTLNAHGELGIEPATDIDSVSICRYALQDQPSPTLASSEHLDGRAADYLLAALKAAPLGSGPDAPRSRCTWAPEEAVVLQMWSGETPWPVLVHYSGCRGHGIDDGIQTRELTTDVLAPILDAPWSGGVDASVPFGG